MDTLAVIPARGGSAGVPGKNIKLLDNKPLIHYTIEVARNLFKDEEILISTDSEEIKVCAERTGIKVPFLRPKELATHTSGMREVLLHALDFVEQQGHSPDILVLLQPTSPFRTANHVKTALELYDEHCEMIVSVKETKSNPYYLLKEEDQFGWLVSSKEANFVRRQDCPRVYELNGAIYVISCAALKERPMAEFTKVRKYEMDEISSHDIDSALDWLIAESIIIKQGL